MNSAPAETTPEQDWAGRRLLVTGGTSGTGLRTALTAAARGARVVVNGRDPERGREALALLRDTGAEAHLVLGDCFSYDVAGEVVSEAVGLLGGLDVLVSAGARGKGDPKPFGDMSSDEIVSGLTTRFLARVHPVHTALPHLRAGVRPSIVLLTTDAGRHATRGESIVGAYAAAVISFTKTLAREESRAGVRVNAVSMTLTAGTQSWESIFGDDSYQKDLFAKAVERFPFGGAPTAQEVADAVVFLSSARAAQVTGQTLSVNGGLSYGGW